MKWKAKGGEKVLLRKITLDEKCMKYVHHYKTQQLYIFRSIANSIVLLGYIFGINYIVKSVST